MGSNYKNLKNSEQSEQKYDSAQTGDASNSFDESNLTPENQAKLKALKEMKGVFDGISGKMEKRPSFFGILKAGWSIFKVKSQLSSIAANSGVAQHRPHLTEREKIDIAKEQQFMNDSAGIDPQSYSENYPNFTFKQEQFPEYSVSSGYSDEYRSKLKSEIEKSTAQITNSEKENLSDSSDIEKSKTQGTALDKSKLSPQNQSKYELLTQMGDVMKNLSSETKNKSFFGTIKALGKAGTALSGLATQSEVHVTPSASHLTEREKIAASMSEQFAKDFGTIPDYSMNGGCSMNFREKMKQEFSCFPFSSHDSANLPENDYCAQINSMKLNVTNEKKLQILNAIHDHVKGLSSDTDGMKSQMRMNKKEEEIKLLKWSMGGFMLLSQTENDAVSSIISKAYSSGSSAAPEKEKHSILANLNPLAKWKSRQNDYEKFNTSTEYSRMMEHLDNFSNSQKHSAEYLNLPAKLKDRLSSISLNSTQEELNQIHDANVEDIAKSHSLNDRSPLIKNFNDFSFSAMSYFSSFGASAASDPQLSSKMSSFNSKMGESRNLLSNLYSNSGSLFNNNSWLSPFKQNDIDTRTALHNRSYEMKSIMKSINDLNNNNKYTDKKRANKIAVLKEKIAIEKENEMMLGMNSYSDQMNWARNFDSGSRISSLSRTFNNAFAAYQGYKACSYVADSYSSAASKLDSMKPDEKITALHGYIDSLGQKTKYFINKNMPCKSFADPGVNKQIKMMKSQAGSISGIANGMAASSISSINSKFSSAQSSVSAVSGSLSSMTQTDTVGKLNSAVSAGQASMNAVKAQGVAKVAALQQQMGAINSSLSTVDTLKAKLQAEVDALKAKLAALMAKLNALANPINSSFCSIDLSALIPHINFSFSLPFDLKLMLKPIFDILTNIKMKFPTLSLPNIDALLNSMKNMMTVELDKIMAALDALAASMENAMKNALVPLIAKLSGVLGDMEALMSKYINCPVIIGDLMVAKGQLEGALTDLKSLMNVPEISDMKNGINKLKGQLTGMIANQLSPFLSTLQNLQSQLDQLKAAMMAELQDLQSQMPTLEGDLMALKAKLEAELQQVADLEAELAALLAELAQMMKLEMMMPLAAAEGCIKNLKAANMPANPKQLGVASGTGMLMCQNAVAPGPYVIPPDGEEYGPGCTIGAALAPTLNPSFGGCTLQSNPTAAASLYVPPYTCMAMVHTPFFPGSMQVKAMMAVSNAFIAGDKCVCLFAAGGQIGVMEAGQENSTLEGE